MPIIVTFFILPSFFISLSWKPRSKSWREHCGEGWILLMSVRILTSLMSRIVSIRIKWFSSGRFSVGSMWMNLNCGNSDFSLGRSFTGRESCSKVGLPRM